jgi:hypothetical protein
MGQCWTLPVIHEINTEERECGDDCLALVCVPVTIFHGVLPGVTRYASQVQRLCLLALVVFANRQPRRVGLVGFVRGGPCRFLA